MAVQSTKPACATALTLAALMLAALPFAAQPTMAQVGQPIAVSAEDADHPVDAPPLPEPLTRQAIRDVLSGLSDGQARELLLRELDRRVAAREAALAGAREPALGALLWDWAVALGRGWVSVIQATPTLPGAAAATFDNFQAERGEASPWRVAGTLMLCLLAGLGAAFGVRRLTRRHETRLDSLSPASLWSRIGIITSRFLLQGMRLIAFVVAAFVADAIVNRIIPADSSVVRNVVQALGWTWFAVMAARFVLSPMRPNLRLCTVDEGAPLAACAGGVGEVFATALARIDGEYPDALAGAGVGTTRVIE